MTPDTEQLLCRKVADVINRATYGDVTVAILAESEGFLIEAGVSSLEVLRVAEELENEFGISIPADAYAAVLASLDTIGEFLVSNDATIVEGGTT